MKRSFFSFFFFFFYVQRIHSFVFAIVNGVVFHST